MIGVGAVTAGYAYVTLDVFTDRTFGGNPLGVFPDAAHLPSDLMQRIAKEMNLSETVFLGPAETEEGTARVRIFTPGREVPFAGHPTVSIAGELLNDRLDAFQEFLFPIRLAL